MSRGLFTLRWPVLCLALLALPVSEVAAAQKNGPRVRLLEVDDRGSSLLVSFRVEKAFDERIESKLESGLEISFRHQVNVRRRRTWWFERGVSQKRVFTTAVRDTLTGLYTLTRKVNGGIVETLNSEDLSEVRTFLAEIRDLEIPLPEGLPRDNRSEVRVRSILETRFWLFFPYPFDTDWVSRPLPDREDEPAMGPAREKPEPQGTHENSGGGGGAG